MKGETSFYQMSYTTWVYHTLNPARRKSGGIMLISSVLTLWTSKFRHYYHWIENSQILIRNFGNEKSWLQTYIDSYNGRKSKLNRAHFSDHEYTCYRISCFNRIGKLNKWVCGFLTFLFSYFYEAFEGFDSVDLKKRAIQNLR